MIHVRRERFGVFSPWLQTRSLRFIDWSNQNRDWHTGSASPSWTTAIESARARLQERRDAATKANNIAYYQRLLDAIDAELAGDFPETTIRWPQLGRDLVYIASHLVLIVAGVRLGIALYKRARADARALEGQCPNCGYDMTGTEPPCPECGMRPADDADKPRP